MGESRLRRIRRFQPEIDESSQGGRMDRDVVIEFIERPERETVGILEQGLAAHARAFAGPMNDVPFAILLRTAAGEIVGGLFGVSYWKAVAIDLFWIAEAYRGQGYGDTILRRAEEEGRKRGALKVFLDTLSFQAPEFYERRGYHILCELYEFHIVLYRSF
jgi:GNAT superfamily N-acetyltransferase